MKQTKLNNNAVQSMWRNRLTKQSREKAKLNTRKEQQCVYVQLTKLNNSAVK